MILYTSGTSGAPKGALITPKMLHWNSLNTTMRLNISQHDIFVSFLPLFHTSGWNVLLTPFLHRGAKVVLTKKFDAERVLKLYQDERATIMFGVPTTMDMMARASGFRSVDLSSVRYAVVGGESMSLELIRIWQAKGVPIRQGFGLTEFGPNVFSLNEEDAVRKIGSIGFPNFYVETRVVNRAGNDVASGEVGELLLRGPVCTPGYWNNDGATTETIVDNWFHTGDLVRFDDEGFFYVAGRKKDMYISGGENVYPVEVELILSQHPDVHEVAVIGIPDAKWGEVGCAYVSLLKPIKSALVREKSDELLAFCQNKLAKYKIPKEVRFCEELPKGDSGKIQKRRLKEMSQCETSTPSRKESV
jgi:fatty-acyl-CoA synthase